MSSDLSTRERFRREALRLFAEHGVDAVSVKRIATAVGTTAPNLYSHFSSREALVADIFRTGYQHFGSRISETLSMPGDFQVRLEALIRLVCRLHDEDTDLFRFLLLTQHQNLHGIDPKGPLNPIELVHRFIEGAMVMREIPRRDPALVTAALVGIVLQAAIFSNYGRLNGTLSASSDDLVALCQKAVS